MSKIIDKEKKEELIKNMFWELRGIYKGLTREVNSLNAIFEPDNNSSKAMDAIEGLGAYLQRIQMYERKFDIAFEKIKLLFKMIFNVEYDFIMEDSVINYCKNKTDYIEYFIMKNGEQVFKKYKL